MTLRTTLLSSLLMFASAICQAQIPDEPKMRFVFSDTDASEVFRIIGMRTGANIVYCVQEKLSISISFSASSTEEAVRSTVAASGLAYKRVSTTYIVAKPDGLRLAVHPYTSRVHFPLQFIEPEAMAKLVENAFNAVTAKAGSGSVTVDAIPLEVAKVREFVQAQDLAVGPRKREVITLHFLSPSLAGPMITSMFPKLAVSVLVASDAAKGDLGIFGSAADVDSAVAILRRIDKLPTGPDGEIVFKQYEVRYASPVVLQKFLKEAMPSVRVTVGPESYTPMEPMFRSMSSSGIGGSTTGSGSGSQSNLSGQGGSQGGSQGGQGGSGGGISQPFQRVLEGDRAKSILLEGTAAMVEKAVQLLIQYDVKPRQVRVEVKVVDTSPEMLSKVGIDYSWSPFNFKELPPGTTPSATIPTRQNGPGRFSRIPWDFSALLQSLVTKSEAKILATPNVQVLDNDDAFIFIGDTLRVKVSQSNGLGGQTITIEEFPVGIILLLRPRVNADGNITMRVHPVVSSVTSQGSDGLPQTSSREAETTIMMKHGETVVIGGLIKDDMRRTVREVPILGSIPILGELFKSRTTDHKRSDIVLFITTHIIDDSNDVVKTSANKVEKKAGDGKGGN